MESVDAVVIGAGVVGLACARALALRGYETVILERHETFGTETSARNSEVIHAGLYYPKDSLKATLCVQGNRRLYDFCEDHGVSHRRCGKLIVATSDEQVGKLEALYAQGLANGVTGLEMLSSLQASMREPELQCKAALLSAETGIVDSHGLMLAILGDAERSGAVLARRSAVVSGDVSAKSIRLDVDTPDGKSSLQTHFVVNAAGLSAQRVAASVLGFPQDRIPPTHWAKGNYYAHGAKIPFSHLIYPVPEPGGLGVHLTLDLGGQGRFGPDVEWVSQLDYSVAPSRADHFYIEVRRYWPRLQDGALVPAFCGIRPKITGPGEAAADFLIQGPECHGVSGLINLFGIESPGLTSSLAIADYVVDLLS
ncbi:NAD(P)/FAD-dependent oxidoreductase [Denitratisoma sp. agr-D3]